MIRINLLPHRAAKRRARAHQFYLFLAAVAILAGAIWAMGFTFISTKIGAQETNNAFLKREVASLDKEIAEIKKLKEQTDSLLARKRVIEALQANRTETVHLFNELARQVPEGIYFKSIKQTGAIILVTGYAQSNARINTLMNNFNDSPILQDSKLIETKAEIVTNRRLNAFIVSASITRQTTDADKKGKKP